MRFSERKGYTEISEVIQTEEMNTHLRNSLWNILYESLVRNFSYDPDFMKTYWASYKKRTLDSMPQTLVKEIKDIFTYGNWFEVYDFLEFILNYYNRAEINELTNQTLERELAGYRFVSGQITDITDKQEIEMLENALADESFSNVKAHLQRALELLSDRKSPDYRNSIKESISAVESIAKEIAQNPKAELGEALKEIEKKGELHGALKKGFLSLYGYTSDADGIRHAMMDEPNLTADDAKFFLLVCTSFVNYLKTKI